MVLSKLPRFHSQNGCFISVFTYAAPPYRIPSIYLFRHAVKLPIICQLQLWKLVLLFFLVFSHVWISRMCGWGWCSALTQNSPVIMAVTLFTSCEYCEKVGARVNGSKSFCNYNRIKLNCKNEINGCYWNERKMCEKVFFVLCSFCSLCWVCEILVRLRLGDGPNLLPVFHGVSPLRLWESMYIIQYLSN